MVTILKNLSFLNFSLCSEPTVWDGDLLNLLYQNYLKLVPSPPCGMVTLFQPLINSIRHFRSEPTVWDGDLSRITSSGLSTSSSEPTVWDGDHFRSYSKHPNYPGSEPTVWDGDVLDFSFDGG